MDIILPPISLAAIGCLVVGCESESEFDGAYYSWVVEGTICEFCLIEGRAHAETQARLDCTFKKDGDSSWR